MRWGGECEVHAEGERLEGEGEEAAGEEEARYSRVGRGARHGGGSAP